MHGKMPTKYLCVCLSTFLSDLDYIKTTVQHLLYVTKILIFNPWQTLGSPTYNLLYLWWKTLEINISSISSRIRGFSFHELGEDIWMWLCKQLHEPLKIKIWFFVLKFYGDMWLGCLFPEHRKCKVKYSTFVKILWSNELATYIRVCR